MTQEEKAKAYDEALKRAKEWYDNPNSSSIGKGYIYAIFPELKESEDEKIRKAIHIYLDWLDGHKDYQPKGDYTIKDMIAWLEKQGEQKPQRMISAEAKEAMYGKPAWSEEDEYKLNMCITAIETSYKWDSIVDWLKSLKQRIGG